jgi:5-carboxymethyl-2-hydroxymuconate isomerase
MYMQTQGDHFPLAGIQVHEFRVDRWRRLDSYPGRQSGEPRS